MAAATVAEALNHPTWRMGSKITVDSATLANKAMEVIEAHHLFGLPYDQVDVVVHPQSIVHAWSSSPTAACWASSGFPSMELPILYALTHPSALDADRARALRSGARPAPSPSSRCAARCSAPFSRRRGGREPAGPRPAAFNAANEVAVGAFLAGRIAFGRISEVIEATLERHDAGAGRFARGGPAADRGGAERRRKGWWHERVAAQHPRPHRRARRAGLRARAGAFPRGESRRHLRPPVFPGHGKPRSRRSPSSGAKPSTPSPGCPWAAT